MQIGLGIACLVVAILGTLVNLPSARLSMLLLRDRKNSVMDGPMIKLNWREWTPILTIVVCLSLAAFGVFLLAYHPHTVAAISPQQNAPSAPQRTPTPETTTAQSQPAPQKPRHLKPQTTPPPASAQPVPTQQKGHDEQINQGSLVQQNSGGINVQQGTTGGNSPIINSPITVGDVPKDISPADLSTLTDFFRRAPNKARVWILADQFSGANPVVDKLWDALSNAGWPMRDQGVDHATAIYPPGKIEKGAFIIVRGEPPADQSAPIRFEANDPVSFIGRALTALKIPIRVKHDPNLPEGEIGIQFEGGFPK
jgi:hypothetical protein